MTVVAHLFQDENKRQDVIFPESLFFFFLIIRERIKVITTDLNSLSVNQACR